jgi:signal transduction histidine kinase
MRERVGMLGGTFVVTTKPGQGFRIAVTLPAQDGT